MSDEKINQFNSQGYGDGYWKCYYDNGKLEYEGNFINGNEDGLWKHYYSNGQLCSKGNFINGNPDGYWKF